MIFTSLTFLIFGVVLFFVYYIVSKKYQWIVLLLGSCVFYIWAGWKYFLFLLGTIVITYLIGLWLGKIYQKEHAYNEDDLEVEKVKKHCRNQRILVLILGILIGAGTLFFLKYFNFFASFFVSLFSPNNQFQVLDLIVPVGISFYTFSSIGYLVDVSRGDIKAETNILKYALFISYFPIVLQGPICSYSELSSQLISGHDLVMDNVSSGARRIVLGVLKKIIIADLIGIVVNTLFNNYGEYHGFIMFIAIVLYVIQLYADFSGFMDIAIGYSEMLGIVLPENFDVPLLSTSLQVFWRKWHITLGRWFKKYIYIPLGGNRVKKWRWVINIMIVWLLTGLWHGASWGFIIWGAYNGVLLVLGGLFAKPIKTVKAKCPRFFNSKGYKWFTIIKTFYLVCIGFLFFRASSLPQAWDIFVESLKFWDWGNIVSSQFIDLGIHWSMYIVFVGAILVCYFANSFFRESPNEYIFHWNLFNRTPKWVSFILYSIIIASTIACYVYEKSLNQTSSAFIYFNF